ncbi:MAG: antirestriction protein ArdA [Leptolyngbya sp. UWPOB_LEPTO1]|uniref:antirestriction protein ArdA n=1 Tax=Leptolyngbya sp. UWPOB_LEPTO1 TaxID=2815653 RepID=UPI001AD392B6|nr:antirestriction protein ArdA [Leptolyngbya sp. UWPOB_LEPTO1]MBN8564761.1 antirestriction protein ArdA [Leptolyngbya sp. UWPOB_LEPTO1]
MSTPRVYFADLAAYNNGHLRGVWVDFYEGIEPDDVQFAIDALLKDSEGEEWRIDAYEGFAEVKSSDLEKLCQVAALIHEHGEEPIKGYFAYFGDDAEIDEFPDYYIGCYKSEAAFCEEHLQIAEAAEKIQVFDSATLDQYINWEAIANDAFISLYHAHKEGYEQIHVYTI